MIRERLSMLQDRMPVRSIDRYLMRHFLVAYAICATAILSLFVVIEGISRLDKFLKEDEALLLVFVRYFMATIPIYFSQYLGPVFTLMAGMFAITILNKGHELTPLKAAGLSMGRILAPFFLSAILLAAAMFIVQEEVIPRLKDQIRVATAYGKNSKAISPDLISDSFGTLIHVGRYFPHQKRGRNVNVQTRHASNLSGKELIAAREIVWEETKGGEGYWLLLDGSIQHWDDQGRMIPNPDAEGEGIYLQRFEEMRLRTDMRPVDLESSDREIPYLSFLELRNQYKRRPHLKHLEVKLHQRFAFPLANVILLLLGLPFVLRGENRSITLGVTAAIAIAGAYLITSTLCSDLGNKEQLPPILAAWLPVLFFGALGLTLFDGIES
ncbi:MAG: LptF/LptG family permease [Planctomycetota bacterium]